MKTMILKAISAIVLPFAIAAHPKIAMATTPDVPDQSIRTHLPEGVRPSLQPCMKQATGTMDIASCITEERDYQDARLNDIYRKLKNSINGEAKESLISAEKAWITSKDRDEAFEATIYGSEIIENLQQGENDLFRIAHRADVLKKYLDTVTTTKPRSDHHVQD